MLLEYLEPLDQEVEYLEVSEVEEVEWAGVLQEVEVDQEVTKVEEEGNTHSLLILPVTLNNLSYLFIINYFNS